MRKNHIKNKHVYFVILAGGSGERLWPLSRKTHPKQLLTIGCSVTLIEQAIDRILPLANSHENIWVSTTKDYEAAIHAQVHNKTGKILVEPVSRNTGASILYCCYKLQQHNPDALVIFLPADAFIPPQENDTFRTHVEQIICAITNNKIITLSGVTPSHPASQYGYIEFEPDKSDTTGLHKIINFHEKPSHAVAQYYIEHHNTLWNIGIFGAQVSVFIDTYKNTAPKLFNSIDEYIKGNDSYEAAPHISIDHAVIEKATNVWTLPAQFTWSDVGNIDVFLKLKKEHEKKKMHLIEIDAHNNIVEVPNHLVAIVGLNDICVVQTDNVLLITKRDKTDLTKTIVHQLKKEGQQEYL